MARAAKSSEGIFTTQKLKALLESGLGGGISSRAALAMAMCREGDEITVHGIDAWFKHLDSNYAIPRASVDGHRRSYRIPEQRWPVLLDIFGIELEDLACDDDSFRRWCFVRRRARRSRGPQTRLSLDLAYYSTAYSSTGYSSSASSGGCCGYGAALIDAERQWLLEQGCHIHDLNDVAMESDTAKVRTLQRAHLLLCHLDADSLDDTVCEEIADYARQQHRPLLLIVEPGVTLTGRCSPARVLQRPKTFGRRYQQQLFSALSTLAEEPLPSRSPDHAFWPRQPAITDHPSISLLPFVNFTGRDEPHLSLDDIAYGARCGSINAWRLWQEGWHWLFVDAPEPMPSRSLECFEQALEKEPDYGLAHAGISIGLCTAMLWGGLGPEMMPKARRHAEQAKQLLPEHPVALYAMGMMTFTAARGFELALDYLRRAVELEPSNAMYQVVNGYLLAILGHAEQGLERALPLCHAAVTEGCSGVLPVLHARQCLHCQWSL